MNETPRPRNPRGSGDRLREEILRAGIDLLDETNDPAALTLRGIARRAGISAPAIYAHFDTLATLIEALLAESFTELTDAVRAAMDAAERSPEKLLAAGRAYVRFGWDHRARYRVMFAESGYAHNAAEVYDLVAAAIRRCVDDGRSASTDPHGDTWLIWAALHGIATLDKPARNDYLRLGPLDRSAMLETVVRRLARLSD